MAFASEVRATKRSFEDSWLLRDVSWGVRFAFLTGTVIGFAILALLFVDSVRGHLEYWVNPVAPLVGLLAMIAAVRGIILIMRRLMDRAKKKFALPALRGEGGVASCHVCLAALPPARAEEPSIVCRHCGAPNLLSDASIAELRVGLSTASRDATAKRNNIEDASRFVPLLVGLPGLILTPAAGILTSVFFAANVGPAIDRVVARTFLGEQRAHAQYVLLSSAGEGCLYEVDNEGHVRGGRVDHRWSRNTVPANAKRVDPHQLEGANGTTFRVVRVRGGDDGDRAVVVFNDGRLEHMPLYGLCAKNPGLPAVSEATFVPRPWEPKEELPTKAAN